MASPIDIAPADTPPPWFGPACGLCGEPALVSWQRRLTDGELAEHHGVLNARHAERLLLADPQLPPPVQAPLPPPDDVARIVHACYDHAITQDAAARIHQAQCTAPAAEMLPACDCTPEPLPEPEPEPGPQLLPAGWT